MARADQAEAGWRARLGATVKFAAAGAVLYFAVEGGEYGTSDLMRVRRRIATTQSEIDSLRRVVDSLGGRRKRLERDAVLQERIAREEFGMVKGDRELLYRFIPADTAADDSSAAR